MTNTLTNLCHKLDLAKYDGMEFRVPWGRNDIGQKEESLEKPDIRYEIAK